MADIIQLNQTEIKSQLSDMVRNTVEETLNAMLDAEADQITQAHKYQRTDTRQDTRAGHYSRKLLTKAGEAVDGKIKYTNFGHEKYTTLRHKNWAALATKGTTFATKYTA